MNVVAYGEANTVLGSLDNVVVHPEDFRVLGYIVRSGWGLMGYKYHLVLAADVNKIGILCTINDNRCLLSIDDVIMVNSIMESIGYLLGKPIVTTKKQKLGRCGDLVLDTSYHQVRAIIPISLLRKKHALPAGSITAITKKAITIKYTASASTSGEAQQLSLVKEG